MPNASGPTSTAPTLPHPHFGPYVSRLRQAVINGNVEDGSYALAETQRMQALAPSVDSSHQSAEDLRFAAIGATADSSVQFAETQRQTAAGSVNGADDNSWQAAEDRRFWALGPAGG